MFQKIIRKKIGFKKTYQNSYLFYLFLLNFCCCFCQSYFPSIFSSFPPWLLWLYSLCAITPLFTLYLSSLFPTQLICSNFIVSPHISHTGSSPLPLGRSALQNVPDLWQILSLLFLVSNRYSADQEHYWYCQVIMHKTLPYTYIKGICKGLQHSVIWVSSCNFYLTCRKMWWNFWELLFNTWNTFNQINYVFPPDLKFWQQVTDSYMHKY